LQLKVCIGKLLVDGSSHNPKDLLWVEQAEERIIHAQWMHAILNNVGGKVGRVERLSTDRPNLIKAIQSLFCQVYHLASKKVVANATST
jgi:hypothetical protein